MPSKVHSLYANKDSVTTDSTYVGGKRRVKPKGMHLGPNGDFIPDEIKGNKSIDPKTGAPGRKKGSK